MFNNKSILIVEDDTSTRLIIQAGCSKLGFKTLAVSSGEEALRTLKLITPDIALIDISLPGIDGLTLADMFNPKNNTVVILMTADKNHEVNTGKKNQKVIFKPFRTAELINLLKQTNFSFE